MKSIYAVAIATAATVMFTTASMAAPCQVGTTSNAHTQHNAGDKSSKVDGGADAKVSPGAKAESPGTVGALSNVGANTQPSGDEKKPAEGKVVKPGSDDC